MYKTYITLNPKYNKLSHLSHLQLKTTFHATSYIPGRWAAASASLNDARCRKAGGQLQGDQIFCRLSNHCLEKLLVTPGLRAWYVISAQGSLERQEQVGVARTSWSFREVTCMHATPNVRCQVSEHAAHAWQTM